MIDKLAAAGLPGEPKLHGFTSVTADYSFETIVSGVVGDRPFCVQLSREAGYQGADARAFASLLQTVLTVAKLGPSALRWRELFDVREPVA